MIKKIHHRSAGLLIIAILPLLLHSCIETFDYSVYSARVPNDEKNTRAKNFAKLDIKREGLEAGEGFKIALISDSHTTYNDLEDAIHAINRDAGVQFILHGGDMTDGGMLAEYLIFHKIMSYSNVPFFTVIGNHDCLANGFSIYQDMFGMVNYSFEFANTKFIFFNDVIWELNFTEPDYYWLRDELAYEMGYDHTIVIAHIAPFSDSFTPLQQDAYTAILAQNDASLSVHGHHHDHYYGEYYEDGVPYLIIGASAKRHYVTLDIMPDTIIMNRIKY